MFPKRADTLIRRSTLSRICERAIQLARLNQCLEKHMPLPIDTQVKLVNIDTRKRAVLHVRGAAWATHVRMQQRMIQSILRSCGITDLQGIVVKNRPLLGLAEHDTQPRSVHRYLSKSTRELVATVAGTVSDERLAHSLKCLAHRQQ